MSMPMAMAVQKTMATSQPTATAEALRAAHDARRAVAT